MSGICWSVYAIESEKKSCFGRVERAVGGLEMIIGRTADNMTQNLRRRTHNIQLPERSSSLIDCNFIIRLLYRDVY